MFAKPRQIARPMSDAAKRISGRLSSGMVRHLSAYYASLSQKVRLISSDPGAELVYLPPRWTIDGVLGKWTGSVPVRAASFRESHFTTTCRTEHRSEVLQPFRSF